MEALEAQRPACGYLGLVARFPASIAFWAVFSRSTLRRPCKPESSEHQAARRASRAPGLRAATGRPVVRRGSGRAAGAGGASCWLRLAHV